VNSASSGASAGAVAAGTGVGGFLSSLFGQSTANDQDVPRTTSSVSQPDATAARGTAGERVAVVSPPATPKPAPEPVEQRAKGFDIEIAALHDRYRAEAVAKQIMVQYSSDFYWSSRKTRVEERAGPDGATLYAVRLGQYDDESSARSFCKKLEAGGFDCELVVRR
jgi:cell division septation protein DedD